MSSPDPAPKPVPVPEAAKPPSPPAAAPAKPAAEAPKPAEAARPQVPAAAPAPPPASAAAPAAAVPAGVGLTRAPKDGPTGIVVDAKTLAMVVSVLAVLVLFFASATLYLLFREPPAMSHVIPQVVGMEGPGLLPLKGTPPAAGTRVETPGPTVPEDVKIGEFFEKFDGKPSAIEGAWPQFRGPNYDNIATQNVKLADRWPDGGPPLLWSLQLGQGYAGSSIHKGKVYVLDYDEKQGRDALRCFSLDDGKEIWRRSYKVKVPNNHGFSRTVPTVTDRHIVTMGPLCHVMCLDTETGDFKWGIDVVKDYGTQIPEWWTSQCPIIDNGAVIIAPGGKDVLLMGVDVETGKVLWKVPNPRKWNMSHSSVAIMNFGARRAYVYGAPEGTIAVSAEPATAGQVLWENGDTNFKFMTIVPPIFEDGHIFLSSYYVKEVGLLKVDEAAGKFSAKLLWKAEKKASFSSEQQMPIVWKGHMFGVNSPEGGPLRNQFVCLKPGSPQNKVVWASGKEKRFGLGPYILADGKFYILSDEGRLTMCRAGLERYEELGSHEVFKEAHEAWGPIALVGTRMLLREQRKFICVDLGKGAP
jgi:outer membrane protein assembly factor BamB